MALGGRDRKPARPGERVVAVVEIDHALVDMRKRRAILRRLERISRPGMGSSDRRGHAVTGVELSRHGGAQEEVRGQLVVSNLELARMSRPPVDRPPEREVDPRTRGSGRQPPGRGNGQGPVTAVRPGPPRLLLLGRIAGVTHRDPMDVAGSGCTLPRHAYELRASFCLDQPCRPDVAPGDGDCLVGSPPCIALARVITEPPRHVQIPASALAGERHADKPSSRGARCRRTSCCRSRTSRRKDTERKQGQAHRYERDPPQHSPSRPRSPISEM
jgi:hypothetical protein